MVQTSWCEILILEVRSQSGEDVPVNLYQTNVLLCPDNKVPSPRAQPSPSKVQVLAKRRPTSVGGSLRARFPDSVQLPSLRSLAPRTQLALRSSGPQKGAGGRAHSLWPRPTAATLRSQRQRLQSGSPAPQGPGSWVAMGKALEPLTHLWPPPWVPSSPAGSGPGNRLEGPRQRPGSALP